MHLEIVVVSAGELFSTLLPTVCSFRTILLCKSGAVHLPKTDLMGSIDCYVKFETNQNGTKLELSSKPETSVKKK